MLLLQSYAGVAFYPQNNLITAQWDKQNERKFFELLKPVGTTTLQLNNYWQLQELPRYRQAGLFWLHNIVDSVEFYFSKWLRKRFENMAK